MNVYNGTRCPACGFDSSSYETVPTALAPMTVLHDRYVVGAVLGKGGYGITYVGYDNKTLSRIAIKECFPCAIAFRDEKKTSKISPMPDRQSSYSRDIERFYNEALTLSKIRDVQGIVKIFDFFYENNTAYIVMEYIDGVSVDKVILNQGPMDAEMTLNIFYPVIRSLEIIHRHGILHRDISPSNIMLDDKLNSRLIDFGASRECSYEMSSELSVFVKNGFAPYEQYSKKGVHTPAEDVYALCASMYYTMTGKVPPSAMDRIVFDTMVNIRSLNPSVPPEIERIISKGMAVKPEDRYSDITSLLFDLDNFAKKEQRVQEDPICREEKIYSPKPAQPPRLSKPQPKAKPKKSGEGSEWLFALLGFLVCMLPVLALVIYFLLNG